MFTMPRPHPLGFRQRAVEFARLGDIDEGPRGGTSSVAHDELVALRRETRTLRLENEILKRPAAYFARENVLPK